MGKTRFPAPAAAGAAILLILAAIVALSACGRGGESRSGPGSAPSVQEAPPAKEAPPAAEAASGREIPAGDLPDEARRTLERIRSGGPFAYAKDGAVFGNRERLLPRKPHGYYREYTVPTPGSPNRGARRIVAGGGGERYYTEDHYGSFKRILE